VNDFGTLFRVATLDNYYRCVQTPNAGAVFADVVRLRATGFGPEYPPNFLPLDRSDFFARHHVIYWQEQPVAAYKQVRLSLCDYYDTEFPLLALARTTGSRCHIEAVERALTGARATGREVCGGGSLSMSLEFRTEHPFSTLEVLDLIAALWCLDHHELDHPLLLTAAARRFKVDRYFRTLGYETIEAAGVPLEPLSVASPRGEMVVLMRADGASQHAEDRLCDYRELLDARERIGGPGDALVAARHAVAAVAAPE
jgi:hypothetical protein